VIQDTEMCIGCKKCTLSCPYEAPAYNPEADIVRKCDGCRDWLAHGMQPACVAACSTRALQFGPMTELRRRYGDRALVSEVRGLADSSLTGPNLLVAPKDEMRI